MLHYLLMCKSLTYAQRSALVLERIGITAIITKAPKSATGQGCNYSVKVSEKNLVRAISALKEAALGPTRVFMVSHDGNLREVQ